MVSKLPSVASKDTERRVPGIASGYFERPGERRYDPEALERRMSLSTHSSWSFTFDTYARIVQSYPAVDARHAKDILVVLVASQGLLHTTHAISGWEMEKYSVEHVSDVALLWNPAGSLRRSFRGMVIRMHYKGKHGRPGSVKWHTKPTVIVSK